MADSYVVEYTPQESGSFAAMPEGTQQVVCVDGIYLGEKVESYQNGPAKIVKKYAFVFQSDEINEETKKPYEISVEYTISMHEKAGMRKFLSAWRGRAYTDEEVARFDISRVVGVNGLANVEHKTSAKGRVYGKLLGVMPITRTMQKIAAQDYTRGAFWETRKAEYAAGVEAHRAALAVAAQPLAAPRQVPGRIVPPAQPLVTSYVDQGHDEDLMGGGFAPVATGAEDEVPF